MEQCRLQERAELGGKFQESHQGRGDAPGISRHHLLPALERARDYEEPHQQLQVLAHRRQAQLCQPPCHHTEDKAGLRNGDETEGLRHSERPHAIYRHQPMVADPAHLCPGYREHAPDTGRSRRACTELALGEGGLRQPQCTGGEHSLYRLCTGGNGQRHQRELSPGTALKTLPLPLHLIPEGEGHRHISEQPHRHLCPNGHKQLSPASGKGCGTGCQGMPQHAAQRSGCEQVRGCGSAYSRHAGQHHPGREPAALCKIQHQRQGVEDTGLGN